MEGVVTRTPSRVAGTEPRAYGCRMSDETNTDKSSKEEQAKVSDEARADNEDTTSGGAPEEPDN